MNRIKARTSEVTDKDLEDTITELGIPYLDMADGPKTQRTISEDGTIIDTIIDGGTAPEAAWVVHVDPKQAALHEYERNAQRFMKNSKLNPAPLTLDV